jgi:molybdopterin-guanine dinucleotide biosynthesis protein A
LLGIAGIILDRCETGAVKAQHAAILAGCRRSRMGVSKAASELAGRPLISYPIAAARAAGLEPLVVAKAASALPALDCPVVTEPDEPTHPLTGIIAALEHLGEPIVAIACDLPLLPPELLAELASRSAPLALPANPRPQPLAARYDPELLPRLRAALIMDEPLVKLAAEIGGDTIATSRLRDFGDPETIFANVNDPAELQRIERLL